MLDFVVDRVLLTNDDGIDAPGLRILEEAARSIAREVWIVAPERDQSGVSHAISLRDPLRVASRDARRFSVSGTPADCVVIALDEWMKGHPPDFLFSGVNRGSNLGVESVFSGTVGAAMAGMLMGVRSIALSQVYTSPNPVRWETTSALLPGVLGQLVGMEWPEACCLNVNFPDVPPSQTTGMTFTEQGPGFMEGLTVGRGADGEYRLHVRRGSRINPTGCETAAVVAGKVSVTPLQFERTNRDALAFLRR